MIAGLFSVLVMYFVFSAPNEGHFIGGQQEIYVVDHGWHTGFVVPAAVIQAQLPELATRFTGAPYLEIGWGDKGFYQAQDITASIAIKALLWPSDSVMHVVAVPAQSHAQMTRFFAYSKVAKVRVNDAELAKLTQFITQSFKFDNASSVLPLRHGLYGDSQFYQGVNAYHLMNTCNKWTAQGLQAMGMGIAPRFKLTASSVMRYLQGLDSI